MFPLKKQYNRRRGKKRDDLSIILGLQTRRNRIGNSPRPPMAPKVPKIPPNTGWQIVVSRPASRPPPPKDFFNYPTQISSEQFLIPKELFDDDDNYQQKENMEYQSYDYQQKKNMEYQSYIEETTNQSEMNGDTPFFLEQHLEPSKVQAVATSRLVRNNEDRHISGLWLSRSVNENESDDAPPSTKGLSIMEIFELTTTRPPLF